MQKRRAHLRFIGISAMVAACMCILSPITLPMGAIPITLSVLALFLAASLAPTKVVMTATAVYLALGAVGLPVFSAFTGGVFAFLSPSGGFLWGYLPVAFVVSVFAQKGRGRLWIVAVGLAAGLVLLYAFGLFGFCVLTGADVWEGFLLAVLPFLLPDALKLCLVLILYQALAKRFFRN